MIFKDFYHLCNIKTFLRTLINELKLQWQCAGLLGSLLKLHKAANLQGSSLIGEKVLMMMGVLVD